MKATFFKTQHDFRQWLEMNHRSEAELIVGYYKVGSGLASMTWSQSVDQALCFGWIDGIRKSIDKESYCIRFTPRRVGSNWSTINIKKVEELSLAGLMTHEGLEVFKHRRDDCSGIYSFEKEPAALDSAYESEFKKNSKAWAYFTSQAPSYQKVMRHWIMSAKQEKTRLSRLGKVIESSAQQKRMA